MVKNPLIPQKPTQRKFNQIGAKADSQNTREFVSDVLNAKEIYSNKLKIVKPSTVKDDYTLYLQDEAGNTNLIQIPMMAATHYPMIKWRDFTTKLPAVSLVAHQNHPTAGDHRHFTIYTTDENNIGQGRFYVEYGRQDIDISCLNLGTFKIYNLDNEDTPSRKNRDYDDIALDVHFRNKVDNGNTYDMSGTVCNLKTSQTETSGTINNSVDVLKIEQHGKTGYGIYVDNLGTGKSISMNGDLQLRDENVAGILMNDANGVVSGGHTGASGSFTTTDGKTVTVTNGIITSIA